MHEAHPHKGTYFRSTIEGEYEVFPVSQQRPHPPLFMAAGTDRSMAYAARHGFGLMLSTLPSAETLAKQTGFYRTHMKEAPAPLNQNPAFGKVDIAHFMSGATSGYLGNVSEKNRVDTLNYDSSPRR